MVPKALVEPLVPTLLFVGPRVTSVNRKQTVHVHQNETQDDTVMDGMLGLVKNDFITYPTVFARLCVHVNLCNIGPFLLKLILCFSLTFLYSV